MPSSTSNNAVEATIKVAEPILGEDEIEAAARVLRSGRLAAGPEVEAFESEYADYTGTRHAVAVSNGTSALYIALECMDIGPGDEVIVPPMSFFATVSAVLYLGATPVFADLDSDDLCMSPDDAHRKVSSKTKAIIPVHLFGCPAKMDRFREIAAETGVNILEDCAQAHGSFVGSKKVGAIGRAGAFSFYATKHMTTGEGGIITTDDASIAEKSRMLRNHGMTGRNSHTMLGYNNRMQEMSAAIGRVQLKRLPELNAARIRNSRFIISKVSKLPWARIPVPEHADGHTFFWCPLMVHEESGRTIEDLKSHLSANNIEFRHRYTEPLSQQPILKKLGHDYSSLELPVANSVIGKVIGLPNHPNLRDDELERICSALEAF